MTEFAEHTDHTRAMSRVAAGVLHALLNDDFEHAGVGMEKLQDADALPLAFMTWSDMCMLHLIGGAYSPGRQGVSLVSDDMWNPDAPAALTWAVGIVEARAAGKPDDFFAAVAQWNNLATDALRGDYVETLLRAIRGALEDTRFGQGVIGVIHDKR